MFGLTAWDLIGWVLFGSLGMIYCAWGKMKERWQPWVLGVALMIFPYFVGKGLLLWVIGGTLSALILIARE